jgi:hypothetical protein
MPPDRAKSPCKPIRVLTLSLVEPESLLVIAPSCSVLSLYFP